MLVCLQASFRQENSKKGFLFTTKEVEGKKNSCLGTQNIHPPHCIQGGLASTY